LKRTSTVSSGNIFWPQKEVTSTLSNFFFSKGKSSLSRVTNYLVVLPVTVIWATKTDIPVVIFTAIYVKPDPVFRKTAGQ
jgi:hypothetical protein